MNVRIIRSEAEHDRVLAEIARLMALGAGATGPERERLQLLALLSETYEDEHHPIGFPDPITAIQVRMEDLGLRPADLAPAMGGRNRVADVFNCIKPLTLPMIRKLSTQLGLPAAVLVQDHPLAERPRLPHRAA